MVECEIKILIVTKGWYGISKQNGIVSLCQDDMGDEFHIIFQHYNLHISELRVKIFSK